MLIEIYLLSHVVTRYAWLHKAFHTSYGTSRRQYQPALLLSSFARCMVTRLIRPRTVLVVAADCLLHLRLITCSVMAGGNVLPSVCLPCSVSASTARSARFRTLRKPGLMSAEQRIPSPMYVSTGRCHLWHVPHLLKACCMLS
jgi:hypothetical protein